MFNMRVNERVNVCIWCKKCKKDVKRYKRCEKRLNEWMYAFDMKRCKRCEKMWKDIKDMKRESHAS